MCQFAITKQGRLRYQASKNNWAASLAQSTNRLEIETIILSFINFFFGSFEDGVDLSQRVIRRIIYFVLNYITSMLDNTK